MTETLTLRPSDAVNLADTRVPCPACLGQPEDPPCSECRGKGSVPKPTGRDHLSYSSIGTQLACLRKYELGRIQRLEPVARRDYLDLGKAFQLGIEKRDPAFAAAALERTTYNQFDADKLRIQQTTVRSAAKLYLATYGDQREEVREYEYRVRLRSPWTGRPSMSFDLLGYADGLTDSGAYLGLTENKLLGQIDKVTIKKLPLDRQIALAAYGCWRATGKEVREVRYRMTRKPSIKPKKDETIDDFCERLEFDYEARPDFYLTEEVLFRSSDDLLRIEAELWDYAEQLRGARRRGFYARNTGHCGDWGGCEFLPICTGDPDAMSLYRTRPKRAEPSIDLQEVA